MKNKLLFVLFALYIVTHFNTQPHPTEEPIDIGKKKIATTQ